MESSLDLLSEAASVVGNYPDSSIRSADPQGQTSQGDDRSQQVTTADQNIPTSTSQLPTTSTAASVFDSAAFTSQPGGLLSLLDVAGLHPAIPANFMGDVNGEGGIASLNAADFLHFDAAAAPVSQQASGHDLGSGVHAEGLLTSQGGGGDVVQVDANEELRAMEEARKKVTDAFMSNKDYQGNLEKVMEHIESARKRIRDLTAFTEELYHELVVDSELSIVAPGTQGLSLPWFKHFYGKDIPTNPDAEARDRYINCIRPVAWTPAERKALRTELLVQSRTALANESSARGVQDVPKIVEATPEEEVLTKHIERIDWNAASVAVNRRTTVECRIRWNQQDRPTLNRSVKWPKDELNNLYRIAENKGLRDWAGIARELGTNRTAAECLRQYRAKIVTKKEWTAEEDELLREAVKMYGENWQSVARHVGRHSNQCINRWTKTLRPNIKKGRWTEEEDEALRSAVASCGMVWKLVAPRVKGRTDAQCRERWCNILDPNLLPSNHPWSKEDETRLMELASELVDFRGRPKWNEISKLFPGRTDNHCLRLHRDVMRERAGKPTKRARAVEDVEVNISTEERPAKKARQRKGQPKGKGKGKAKAEGSIQPDGVDDYPVPGNDDGEDAGHESDEPDAEDEAREAEARAEAQARGESSNGGTRQDPQVDPQLVDVILAQANGEHVPMEGVEHSDTGRPKRQTRGRAPVQETGESIGRRKSRGPGPKK